MFRYKIPIRYGMHQSIGTLNGTRSRNFESLTGLQITPGPRPRLRDRFWLWLWFFIGNPYQRFRAYLSIFNSLWLRVDTGLTGTGWAWLPGRWGAGRWVGRWSLQAVALYNTWSDMADLSCEPCHPATASAKVSPAAAAGHARNRGGMPTWGVSGARRL